jgi:hypothetical protein
VSDLIAAPLCGSNCRKLNCRVACVSNDKTPLHKETKHWLTTHIYRCPRIYVAESLALSEAASTGEYK